MTSNTTNKEGEEKEDNHGNKKHVSFSTADIYVFLMTVGDNPAVTKGPPVQIEWKPHQVFSHVDLNELEAPKEEMQQQLPQRQLSKDKNNSEKSLWNNQDPSSAFRLVRSRRIAILKEQGFTMDEIQQAEKEAFEARNERRNTILNKRREYTEERRETRRNFWSSKMSVLKRQSKSREQRRAEQFLQRYEADHPQDMFLSRDLDKLPSICKNCAEVVSEDISTTRVGYLMCHGECQQSAVKTCMFTGKPLADRSRSKNIVSKPDEAEQHEQTSTSSAEEVASG
mmetsp:Transcript_6906/g.14104  ORF Transcript_6906/g.14104 Transcript_6906/m.14104 type:complete len:283 (+) Transcript_6906:129-977(+)|eukprot:CAMPEP_0168756910 /NCGR_PEP_ID=MMETSP0724-20121128/20874_1 /TAXON_ID=265536 /ORGANISM="Amphiprora sp., Strain CCMP467" /LENGTH=282 /DNA_ID=CAMNT_0008805663 /DNA_START=35 /DNA_END=883 /DNA_ORIENTATION=+